jgi:hypothetical protein
LWGLYGALTVQAYSGTPTNYSDRRLPYFLLISSPACHRHLQRIQQVIGACRPQVLTHNLGIPIIVCACKADALETLMNEQRISSEQIDFIQAYLRRFCLR